VLVVVVHTPEQLACGSGSVKPVQLFVPEQLAGVTVFILVQFSGLEQSTLFE
jgi:hypothetical protein